MLGREFDPYIEGTIGHGLVFEVWILISSGIIQIRTRGFGVI